jgi:hypothetical protein
MPANSTTLEFIDQDGTTLSPSVVQSPEADSTLTVLTTDKVKGDGYYKGGDGLHTVHYSITDFSGTVKMQASLATSPASADWFDIAGTTYTTSPDTDTDFVANFTGNFVWLRAIATYTNGRINSIKVNY